jgi:SagB-type dehydrogenase family enzyme
VGNDYIEAARVYHEVTKHSYTSVRSGGYDLDWDNRPLAYKIYPDAAAIALPRDLSLSQVPALRAMSADAPLDATTPIGLEHLTRLLFCAGGLTRTKRIGDQDYHFRAAASAGALYPIEIYLAAAEIDGLEAGLYHFSPADLRLTGLRRGDFRGLLARAAAMRPTIANARAVVLLSSIFWRSAWKYRARAYRYCCWDAGTILANLLAAASAEQIPAEVVTAFADPSLEVLLGIDGRREGAIAMVPLGCGAHPPALAPDLTPLSFESIPLSPRAQTFDDLVRMHQESRLVDEAEVARVTGARVEPRASAQPESAFKFVTHKLDEGCGLGETILRRGSTRAFAQAPIPAADLATILAASARTQRADFPTITDIYLIVNAVEGMQPGAYYYRRDGSLEVLKAGNFRAEAGYLCLEQPLGMDCSALIVYMADLERVLRALSNRGYRDAHLEAGLFGGRAYLATYALDRGATGLTFYDDDTTRFFEPHGAGLSPLLMVAIGVPRSRVTAP